MWMNVGNYGGIKCNSGQQSYEGNGSFEETPSYEEEDEIHMQWNLKQYLPPFIQPHFDTTIAEYLQLAMELKLQRRAQQASGQQVFNELNANSAERNAASYDDRRKVIREIFSPKLLDIVASM